jgi:hypothetical protein
MNFNCQLQEKLGKEGVFLISGNEKHFNGMTISWGQAGVMWGKEVLIVPVRTTRFTYSFLLETGCFTVCIPKKDMRKQLAYFGTKSGRDTDKFKDCNLETLPCREISCIAVKDCYIYECKVVYSQTISPEHLSAELMHRWYENDAAHTMFYGEIVAQYET